MVSESHENFGVEANDKTNRVLLIDLENCPNQVQQLMKNLEQYSHVVVCYAQSGAKIPLDWIVPLTATVNDNRLKVVKMPNGGKNAADFGITFWAGVLMSQLPLQAHFTIVSNDADLDHVVSLLISQQRSAERIGSKKETILLSPEINEPAITVQNRQIQEYCLHLVNHNKNRPAKKETLINNIKSKFKDDGIVPEELFNQLIKECAITLKEVNKITYNEQKIAKLAKI
ncbi:MAG: NYN domain-containing protein [Methyloglobulus sp.]|nr:NYN domain-containing protein [Methyloglobulus sp.]